MKLMRYINTPLFALSLATISSTPYAQTFGGYTESNGQTSLPFAQIYAKVAKQYPNPIVISSYVEEAGEKTVVYFELFRDGKVLELDVDPASYKIKVLQPEPANTHHLSKVSLNEAISLAETNTNATAISIELDKQGEKPVYFIVLESDNKQYFVVMDANNAAILETKQDNFELEGTPSKINLAQAIALAETETGGRAIQAFLDFGQANNSLHHVGIEMLINNQLHLVTVDTQAHKVSYSSSEDDQQLIRQLSNGKVKLSPLDQIVTKLKKRYKGKFVSSELLLAQDKLTYGISLVRGEESTHFSVDAQSGKLLGSETLHINDFDNIDIKQDK